MPEAPPVWLASSQEPVRPGATPQEDEWVRSARAGDPEAFGELVRLHQRRVWGLCSRFFAQRSEVEDAAQQTFLTAWSKLHTYRARAPFEHWLTRVCLRCCYRELRRRPAATEPLETASAVASRPTGDACARVDADRLLARLPPADRFLLVLLESFGLSTAEVAERLGWSRVNVKVRAHRARRRLRTLAGLPESSR
mgnify:CR=1 FL=1